MAKLLFVATAIYGHVAPLQAVAADLVTRGHDVTFITGPAFEDGVRATGARFVPVHGVADVRMEDLATERDGLAPGPDQLNFDMQRLFTDPVPVQHDLIQRELAAAGDRPTVLVTDSGCLGGWPVALGAPGLRPAATIALGITMYPATSVDAPPAGLGIPLDTSEAGRAGIAEANAGYRAVFTPTQTRLAEVLGRLGVTEPIPLFFDGLARMPDRLLQLSPAGFEYPRSDAPPGLRFVGPIPAAPPTRDVALPAWWPDVERAERVVVVSQGTVANLDTDALFAPALRGLADTDALVVVATGRADTALGDVPANARVGGFVPFDLLLPHADVLVTNGGYGGVLKALSHGLPLVVAGDTEDKPEIAAHVAWSGAGIDLGTGHPTDQAVEEAVRVVLRDPSYARAARRLQAEITDLNPFDEIAAQIDDLLAATTSAAGGVSTRV